MPEHCPYHLPSFTPIQNYCDWQIMFFFLLLLTCKNKINCGNRCTGFTMSPKNESRSWALICLTLKKSARADFRFASIFANSIAAEKLLMKPLYISKMIGFPNEAMNASATFSSLSQFRTHSASAMRNSVWQCKISGKRWNNMAIFDELSMGGLLSSSGFL